MLQPDISIVVPVYHGEKTIESLLHEIQQSLSQSCEVVFVYDCGPDRSWEKIVALKKQHPELIKAIHLSRNYGQHNAIICGFEHAVGRFVVTMDEDLQHHPSDIQLLLQEQQKGNFDVVYGSPKLSKHNRFRNFTSHILRKLISIGIPDMHHDYSPFRLIECSVAKKTIGMQNSYTFLDGYLSWITSSISSCEVSHNERYAGKSSYTLRKLINHSINIFITFSNLPIRVLTKVALFTLSMTVVYSIYIIFRKIILDDLLKGFPTITILLGFGISLIMLGLGIIGEYLHRINLKTTRRPNYNVKHLL